MKYLKRLQSKIKQLFSKEPEEKIEPEFPKTGVFVMTVDTAIEFYERCINQKAETEEERQKILLELSQEGKMDRAYLTNRSKDQVIKDLAREHKVLHIKNKEKK
jgi:hypothetical protein